MRHGYMNQGDGGWWWIVMLLMMVVVVAGALALAMSLARRDSHGGRAPGAPTPPPSAYRPTPQEILAERLARGEIEPDDYRRRLEALQPPPPPDR